MEQYVPDIYKHIIAVTNRHLCRRPFEEQIESICKKHPRAVLLREKDLTEDEYASLFRRIQEICHRHEVPCIPHTFIEAARQQGSAGIHLPLHILTSRPEAVTWFQTAGASVHSVQEAAEAEKAGAAYLIAGHIFSTNCKPGLAPRGKEFLRQVCAAVEIPVYAIGGMRGSIECVAEMLACGAVGICVMSECMMWESEKYIR